MLSLPLSCLNPERSEHLAVQIGSSGTALEERPTGTKETELAAEQANKLQKGLKESQKKQTKEHRQARPRRRKQAVQMYNDRF